MKILFLNQTYHPDVVSTAQHLTDLATALAARGHDVTVIAGAHGYDDPSRRFKRRETVHGVRVIRLPYTALGKKRKLHRAVDFATFGFAAAFRLLFLTGRQDVTVALTSPPLVAAIGLFFRRLKGGRFIYWVMDMNPDEAVAAGWLSPESFPAKLLRFFSRRTLLGSDRVVALDRFMKRRIMQEYGVPESRVAVIPPWSHDEALKASGEENLFRRKHGLDGKFVVMYSGNHSPCHPLDTVLECARRLKGDASVVFCFVGGGSLTARVAEFKRENRLENILQLPYQPLERLSDSLSAADLHLVVMGDAYVGIVHPCKIYGVLAVGRPFAFIGPAESHIADIIAESGVGRQLAHGSPEALAAVIAETRSKDGAEKARLAASAVAAARRFGQERLVSEWVAFVEDVEKAPGV